MKDPSPSAGTGLPAGLDPPVKVALARAVTKMPRVNALPGGSVFEPKWDGYRAVGIRDDNGATLWSRQGKDLTRYFPELVAAIASEVPSGCVIDGEAVIWTGGRLDFSALQQRLGAGPKTLPGLVSQTPANYVAFDVLAVAGHDARALPLHQRRPLLEELAHEWKPPLSLPPSPPTRTKRPAGSRNCPAPASKGWSSKAPTSPTPRVPAPG
jgi:ATP-dependent DNA ligase